jgi:hypothetical protein
LDNCELTRYLTLDVLLTSESDLTGLVNALEKQGIFIVYNGQNEAVGFYAVLEPPVDDESPDTQTKHIAKLVEGLAPNIHQMWSECKSRIFDFGFESGFQPVRLEHDLSKEALESILAVGAEMRISIYSTNPAPNPSFKRDWLKPAP